MDLSREPSSARAAVTAGRCCGGCLIALVVLAILIGLFIWWFDSAWDMDIGLF